MVGLAVGVVENGRITFLKGYGETARRDRASRSRPDTVFRWASVSKGVAATMVAKLAEEGKIDLDAPVVNYAPGLKLPGAATNIAPRVGDLLSHRLGLYRNAYDNKLEEGQRPALAAPRPRRSSTPICPPGTCWSYQNVAYDASSEIVARATGEPYDEAVKRLAVRPARHDQRQHVDAPSWRRTRAGPGRTARASKRAADGRHLLQGAGGGRGQQQHQGHERCGCWRRWARCRSVLDQQLLTTIHAPLVKTPGERGRLRNFLERLGDRLVRLWLAQL